MAKTKVRPTTAELKRRVEELDEPRAVAVLRRELNEDVANVAAAIEGLRKRIVALEHYKAPIDRTTERQLEELHERLSTVVGDTRREGVDYDEDDATDTAEVLAGQKNETDERPEITVLVGDHCDTIFGLRGIAEALVALDEPEGLELAIAARELVKRLCGGLGCLLDDVEKRIEQGTGMTVRS